MNISTFYIISYDSIQNKDALDFEIISKNGSIQGFLDILLLNNETEEFKLNDAKREEIFNIEINLFKGVNKTCYYININLSEKKEALYYFQFSFNESKLSEKEKNKVKFYYLNDFKNYTLTGIMNNIRNNEKKRGWRLNGNSEILVFEYKNLKENINLTLKYEKIKGEGIFGFIFTISILFVLLFITLGFFLKNGYFGYRKTDSCEEK